MAKKKDHCPYCGSKRLGQPSSNYVGRTISKTVGVATGLTLACAGHAITFGRLGDKVANFVAGNVIEPIGDIVPRRYKCKSCGKEFE